MGLAQVPRKESNSSAEVVTPQSESNEWITYAACGSLIAGGVLLLTGQRRAGLAAAVSGAALALLDQQDLLRTWWKQLPGYVDQVQHLVDQVQSTVEEVAVRRESLRQVLNKAEKAEIPL